MKRRQNTSGGGAEHLGLERPRAAPCARRATWRGRVDRLGDRSGSNGLTIIASVSSGRAGEAREDQHAGIVGILGGDVFLGHQVHAVAQRRHQPDAAER